MKSNWINNVHIEGYVFSHSLQARVAQKTGTPFIMGDLQIATDGQAMNVVSVHFTYVTEKYSKSGNDNPTYGLLLQLINDGKTYETVGTSAPRVRVDGNIDVNDFYTRDGQLASPKRISGSFVHLMNAEQPIADDPATFEAEMFINGMELKEYDNADDALEVKGYVFNFRGEILPVSFMARMPEAISYFQSQSTPLLTKLWGHIVSTTVENKTEVESAFGAPTVNVSTRTLRSWDITGAAATPLNYPSEFLAEEDLKQATAIRVQKLAEEKKRHDDYIAQRDGNNNFGVPFDSSKVVNQSPTISEDFKF